MSWPAVSAPDSIWNAATSILKTNAGIYHTNGCRTYVRNEAHVIRQLILDGLLRVGAGAEVMIAPDGPFWHSISIPRNMFESAEELREFVIRKSRQPDRVPLKGKTPDVLRSMAVISIAQETSW